ncbi:arsenate-mycothiol transferase ArsC [Halorussus salinisoli]|uniref:arsenate-mycothiol transferase ArsC n=1 Tax=Halorussus salinisoli TaxID=2558242 RepID=UPI0010C1B01E
MATAFAEREARERREASERDERHGASEREAEQVEIVTGGTDPAAHVHDEVVEVMAERDFDLSDRTPREVTHEELQACNYVITMGCSAKDVCPATWSGENRDWGLDDPDGQDLDAVRAIRDEIEERVKALFDELERGRPAEGRRET